MAPPPAKGLPATTTPPSTHAMTDPIVFAPAIDVSVVVIGRNEGARLERCLLSVRAAHWGAIRHELIYVDSNSVDGSAKRAARLGARVLSIGGAKPSAAAGRNIGWRAASGQLVLFLDGDTLLAPHFVLRALATLTDERVVAVWGHRREADPWQSIYTRVLDLDWIFATGTVDYFGGDVLVRREALTQVDGFDASLVAGEEPELCRRLRAHGWQIEHIDAAMTMHDLAINSLHAYWRRAERAGLAYAQVAERFANTADPLWLDECRRNRRQGGAMLALPFVLAALIHWAPLAAALVAAALAALMLRSASRCRWKCPGDPGLALLYAVHSQVQQVPILFGQWRWHWLARHQRQPDLVEYKGPQTAGSAK
jgi:hypothetical protein